MIGKIMSWRILFRDNQSQLAERRTEADVWASQKGRMICCCVPWGFRGMLLLHSLYISIYAHTCACVCIYVLCVLRAFCCLSCHDVLCNALFCYEVLRSMCAIRRVGQDGSQGRLRNLSGNGCRGDEGLSTPERWISGTSQWPHVEGETWPPITWVMAALKPESVEAASTCLWRRKQISSSAGDLFHGLRKGVLAGA